VDAWADGVEAWAGDGSQEVVMTDAKRLVGDMENYHTINIEICPYDNL
jgi:hypothetical protein